MTAPAAWPSDQGPGRTDIPVQGDDHAGTRTIRAHPPGQEDARAVISEMADLARDTQGSIMADGCLLGASMIGFALERGFAARALRPSLIGVVNLGLLDVMLVCWLVAVFLLARASRPVLSTVNELRWVTGAPLDPRASWVTLPPVGVDPAEWTWNRAYLLLGAARLARYRMQFADTWAYLTGGYFLAWTALIVLGL